MTVQEIINNAMIAGSTQFYNLAIEQAEMHDQYFRSLTASVRGREGAKASRDTCRAIAEDIKFGALNDICADLGKCVIALNIACKMLGLSPSVRTKAIVAWEETQRSDKNA